ncbi:MAG: DNA-binding response regulator, partial [Raoultibacter sp.]
MAPKQQCDSIREQTSSTFAGYRLLGLGFWQAWWMISMCTDAILPSEHHYPDAGSTTLWILVMTTLGYLVIVLLSKRFSPLSANSLNFMLAGGLTATGSLLLPISLTMLDGTFGFSLFIASGVAVSVGNAILLVMWGELWSALATGRVGRHLYYSYAFAFVLFFIAYFLPSPFDSIFTALLPIVSAAILRSCKNEPRRSPSITP